MLLIGIETSGVHGSVALVRDDVCLQTVSLNQAGRRHAQSLVLELREMLHAHGATPRDVDAIAVSRGPGSFTGLRVGIVCGKTFAYATGCRFAAVDTFAATAMNCPSELRDVWIVEDAQRGDLFAGRYARNAGDDWVQVEPIAVVAGDEWLAARPVDDVVAGRGLVRYDKSSSPARLLADDSIVTPTAARVAELGRRRLQQPAAGSGESDLSFWDAVPFYIRPSAAEEKREQVGPPPNFGPRRND
jgi:tRNA threonylcarbamoyladenosine biosynthesis protein TsaB